MQIIHYPFPPPGDAPAQTEREPYPAPALTSDMPTDRTPSQPVATLLRLASSHGWEGVITHATGHMPHATHGTPTAVKDSEAIRLARSAQRAVAVRRGGVWESLWTWSDQDFFTRHGTLAAFKAALSAQPVDNPVDNYRASDV